MFSNAISLSNVTSVLGIPSVNQSQRYWMVRTNSGAYYQDFTLNGYIAINWDYITSGMIKHNDEDAIKELIRNHEATLKTQEDDEIYDNDAGRITGIYNKLVRFVNEFSIGDIVIIPSQNTANITIGVISSNVYEDSSYVKTYLKENPLTDIKPCSYHKRRKVTWLKTIPKEKIDLYLLKALGSHHAIFNIDDYVQFINRSIYDVYQIGDELHAIFHSTREDGISLYELRNFFDSMADIIDDTCKNSGEHFSTKDVDVKLNIHSPGIIEICSGIAMVGIAISLVITALNHYKHGGKFHLSARPDNNGLLNFEITSESKGQQQYKLDQQKLEMMYAAQKAAEIEFPELTPEGRVRNHRLVPKSKDSMER